MSRQGLIRIKSKKDPNYVVSVHPEHGVILMPLTPNSDHQLWIIDVNTMETSGFLLINKAYGKALKADLPHDQVTLSEVDPLLFDKSLLWKWRFGDKGFGGLQNCGKEYLFLDINEEKVEAGSQILLWEWRNKAHQKWAFQFEGAIYTIRSKLSNVFALSATPSQDKLQVAMANLEENDPRQLWTLEVHPNQSFALRNIAHNLVLTKGPDSDLYLSGLAPLESVLWDLGKPDGDNYVAMRPKDKIELNLDAVSGEVHHGSGVVLHSWNKPKLLGTKDVNLNQKWGFFPLLEDAPVNPI